MIPFVTPDLTGVEAQAAYDVVMSGYVNEGKLTKQFETEFAKVAGTKYAVATTSATAALTISLMALHIKDKEVIIPDVTMIGTAMAVVLSQNTPVVVDVKLDDGCIDPQRVKEAINKKTAAIIPVHLNGRNALSPELLQITKDYNLAIVEDAACCVGSMNREAPLRQLGTMGAFGCFSLAATKIITTGQGGVMVTNDAKLYERAARLKDWGRFEDKSTSHPKVGFNFKFNDILAAIALKQLERLPELVRRKKEIYARYRANLGNLIFSPQDYDGFCPWYVEVKGQRLSVPLLSQGIHTSAIWPALHQQGAMGIQPEEYKFPHATALAKEILWLPSWTQLKNDQIDLIGDIIKTVI